MNSNPTHDSQAEVLAYATPPDRAPENILAWIGLLWAASVAAATMLIPMRGGDRRWSDSVTVSLLVASLVGSFIAFAARKWPGRQTLAGIAIALASLESGSMIVLLFAPVDRAPTNPRNICINRLHQVGIAIRQYTNSQGGFYPPDLPAILSDDFDPIHLVCPLTTDTAARGATNQAIIQNARSTPGHCSYVYCGKGLTTQTVTPAHVIAHDRPANHGTNVGITVLFGDGSDRWLDWPEASYVISELQAGFNPPRPKPSR